MTLIVDEAFVPDWPAANARTGSNNIGIRIRMMVKLQSQLICELRNHLTIIQICHHEPVAAGEGSVFTPPSAQSGSGDPSPGARNGDGVECNKLLVCDH